MSKRRKKPKGRPQSDWTWYVAMAGGNHPLAVEAREKLAESGGVIVKNALYTVWISPGENDLIALSIKRNDRSVVRDWRHLQRIKNELIGEDAEAVELFPSEARLVDEANQYHLFCLRPGLVFGFGDPNRQVGTAEEAAAVGAKQREREAEEASYAPGVKDVLNRIVSAD